MPSWDFTVYPVHCSLFYQHFHVCYIVFTSSLLPNQLLLLTVNLSDTLISSLVFRKMFLSHWMFVSSHIRMTFVGILTTCLLPSFSVVSLAKVWLLWSKIPSVSGVFFQQLHEYLRGPVLLFICIAVIAWSVNVNATSCYVSTSLN